MLVFAFFSQTLLGEIRIDYPYGILTDPAIAPGGTVYIGAHGGGKFGSNPVLYAFDAQGKETWAVQFHYPYGILTQPRVSPNGQILIGVHAGGLVGKPQLRVLNPDGTEVK